MAHLRKRNLSELIKRRLKLWPVVGVTGARQTGKSVLLREIVGGELPSRYISLDSMRERKRAERSPESFVQKNHKRELLIVDEIQKVPALFDAIKLLVDEERIPGSYIVTGSTEFSKKTGVRESLTGRIALSQLFPMNLAEIHQTKMGAYFLKDTEVPSQISLDVFDKNIARGGMPGMCFLRSDAEFSEMANLWLETTCYRDMNQYREGKFEGALALDILYQIASLDEASAAAISRGVKKDSRIVSRYLNAFEALFVVRKLNPHPAGIGKPLYILLDSGMAHHLEAKREVCLKSHLAVQALSTIEYTGSGRCKLEYFRNEKTSRIPLIVTPPKGRLALPAVAIRLVDGEAPDRSDFDAFSTFEKRGGKGYRKLVISHTTKGYRDNGVLVAPLRG